MFWGLLFTLITPPFQAPDEPEHMFKMWGYTQGSINYKLQDNWVGTYVPVGFAKMYYLYTPYRENFKKVPFEQTQYISTLKLEKNKQIFLRYNAPAYTPLSYFPAFLVLWVLKLLNIAPLLMTYLMRICFLLIYTALGYLAIKTTPCKKWIFFIMQTLPLLLTQAASINTDALFFGIIFVFYAYTLRLRFDKSIENISNKQICIWSGLASAICLLKFAYAPLLLLYFLIPKEKTECEKKYYTNFLLILLVNFIILLFFSASVLTNTGYRMALYATISNKQIIMEILTKPFEYLGAVLYSTKIYFENKLFSYEVITSFGTAMTVNLYWLLLLLSVLYKQDEPKCTSEGISFNIKSKAVLLTVIVTTYLAVLTSVYVLWQHFPFIRGMQGRYLTPVLPAFLLLLVFNKISLKNRFIPWVIVLVSQFLLFITILRFINNFY